MYAYLWNRWAVPRTMAEAGFFRMVSYCLYTICAYKYIYIYIYICISQGVQLWQCVCVCVCVRRTLKAWMWWVMMTGWPASRVECSYTAGIRLTSLGMYLPTCGWHAGHVNLLISPAVWDYLALLLLFMEMVVSCYHLVKGWPAYTKLCDNCVVNTCIDGFMQLIQYHYTTRS